MTIEDIMTRDVITVSPETPIHKAARLMADHGISGLPVIDDAGRLVGVISDGDLILRQRSRRKAPWWHWFLEDGEQLARDYQKSTGTTVGEVMTRSVLSVHPAYGIETAASILDARGIRRLPVVRNGELVGIISRGDLVRALAASLPRQRVRLDVELVEEMKARMAGEPWASTIGFAILAKNGVIFLWGLVRTAAEKAALETMARSIKGCQGVENELRVAGTLPSTDGV
jgi:CBS domain-containing protein